MGQIRKETTKEQKGDTSFPFVGEMLALDLVNTDVLLRGKKHEFLTTPQDAMRWWREATLQHLDREKVKGEEDMTQWNAVLLMNLKRLRDALRPLFMAVIERRHVNASNLEELNRAIAMGHQSLEMSVKGELTPIYQTMVPEYGAVLVPIALSALHLLTEMEQERLHKCANERCAGLFYDTTRSATRHWCSTECMNRARSIQHYREMKAKKALLASTSTEQA